MSVQVKTEVENLGGNISVIKGYINGTCYSKYLFNTVLTNDVYNNFDDVENNVIWLANEAYNHKITYDEFTKRRVLGLLETDLSYYKIMIDMINEELGKKTYKILPFDFMSSVAVKKQWCIVLTDDSNLTPLENFYKLEALCSDMAKKIGERDPNLLFYIANSPDSNLANIKGVIADVSHEIKEESYFSKKFMESIFSIYFDLLDNRSNIETYVGEYDEEDQETLIGWLDEMLHDTIELHSGLIKFNDDQITIDRSSNFIDDFQFIKFEDLETEDEQLDYFKKLYIHNESLHNYFDEAFNMLNELCRLINSIWPPHNKLSGIDAYMKKRKEFLNDLIDLGILPLI